MPRGPARNDGLKRAAELLARAVPVAAAYGVRLAVETHDDLSSAHTMADLLAYAGGSAGAVYDSHHPHRMNERPGEVLAVLGDYLWHVQVKDARRLEGHDRWQLVPLGQGEVPVRELVSLLPGAGYEGWVSLEFERKRHPELAPADIALPPQVALLREWVAQPGERAPRRAPRFWAGGLRRDRPQLRRCFAPPGRWPVGGGDRRGHGQG